MTRDYTVEALPVESVVLKGNGAGDPYVRQLLLLVPPGFDPNRPLPVIWMIAAHGGSQGGFLSNDPWREGLPQRLGRLTAAGAMPPVIAALPDLFTRYGGSQCLDSEATGAYETHLWTELKPALERYCAVQAHGICGHSSGGYAALVQAMKHPDVVKAAAAHAPDSLFEYGYLPDFPKAATRLRSEGGVEKFMKAFDAAVKKQDGLALPFDLETAELIPQVWERWLVHDPIRMLDRPTHVDALRSLRLLFVDAGSRDEWNLQWAARALTRKLRRLEVPVVSEEFDDGHMGTAYRFDRSLPLLASALTTA
jgi:enterochelin esterase family protein